MEPHQSEFIEFVEFISSFMMKNYFTEREMLQTLSKADILKEVKEAYISHWKDPQYTLPRRRIKFPEGIYHTMSSYYGKYKIVGTKSYITVKGKEPCFRVIASHVNNPDRVYYFEADQLGRLRTAASTILAVSHFNRGITAVTLVGAGRQGAMHLEFLLQIPSLKEIRIYSKTASRTEAMIDKVKHQYKSNTSLVACKTLEESLLNTDTIITTTYSKEPIITTKHLEKKRLICAVGANYPSRYEVAEDVFKEAALISVDDIETSQIEGADIMKAIDSFTLNPGELVPFGEALDKGVTSEKLTIFKSYGIAVLDIAIAGLFLRTINT